MANTIDDGGALSPKNPNWNVIGDAIFVHDRGGMPGGSIDLAYCHRFADQFCADGGIGFFGTRSSGPSDNFYGSDFETARVPNLHFGATYFVNETFGVGLRGRLGYALMSGEQTNLTGTENYSERGLYLEGAARLIGNVSMHKVLGFGIHVDGGIASFPASGPIDRSAGFIIRPGMFVRF